MNELTTAAETPVQHLNLAPEEANNQLSIRLRMRSGLRVNFVRKNGSLVLEVARNASLDDLRDAQALIEDGMVSGPVSEVMAELAVLTAVTRRPSHISEDGAKLYFAGIAKAMMDYPLDVVKAAFVDWRKGPQGEWWPAEAEIRRVCEFVGEEREKMLRDVKQKIWYEEREASLPPPRIADQGPTEEFMALARKRCTESQWLSYFSRYAMRRDGKMLYTKSKIGEIMVRELAGDLLKEFDLGVTFDANPKASWPEYMESATDEQRNAFAARLRALAGSIGGKR